MLVREPFNRHGCTRVGTVALRLRAETRVCHNAVEHTMQSALNDLTLERFEQLLRQLIGFYESLETASVPLLHAAFPHLGMYERRRVPFLESSLALIGIPAPDRESRAPNLDIVPTHTVEHALGTWYVVEGATLGGNVIAARVQTSLPSLPDGACNVFRPYAKQTGIRWREFLHTLNQHCVTVEQQNTVVKAAIATFTSFDAWVGDANPLLPATVPSS